MASDLLIRQGELGDLQVLVEFNQALIYETENKQLPINDINAGVKTLLKNPSLGFYLLAQKNNQVVGSLMVTTEWSDWRNGLYWWIQSVYVNPDFRRQGVFKALYQAVKQQAKTQTSGLKVSGFRLYVEKENVIAKRTYQSLGMEKSHYEIFEELLERKD
ncbi:GNAT family N-acetyltransferase [Cylindrospermopsis raciborskii]|uniref:GNAT family N-acetyltransferase n=1 Tax=Cylindrospermopsis raciborskii TaxID=77022 RepID=UPI001FD314B6|nr:GNAT family N-acetyltransferase [Cylindrospermopsis raciborskii]